MKLTQEASLAFGLIFWLFGGGILARRPSEGFFSSAFLLIIFLDCWQTFIRLNQNRKYSVCDRRPVWVSFHEVLGSVCSCVYLNRAAV